MKNFIEDSAEQIMLNSMANVFITEKLDPVGKEDADIDNDGDSDKSDSYLRNRRKAVGAAIASEKAKRVKKEELEVSLRQKVEGLTEKKLYRAEKATVSDEKDIAVEEKPVKNTIVINPDIQEARDAEVEKRGKKVAELEREGRAKGLTDRFRKEYPGSREKKKERGAKKSEGDRDADRRSFSNKLQMKYGRTKKQQKEAESMSKHTSARD